MQVGCCSQHTKYEPEGSEDVGIGEVICFRNDDGHVRQGVRAANAPRSSAPGFVAHVAFVGDDGFHVSEIWESRDDFQNWFDNNVKPNVPGVEIDVVREVHNVIIKK